MKKILEASEFYGVKSGEGQLKLMNRSPIYYSASEATLRANELDIPDDELRRPFEACLLELNELVAPLSMLREFTSQSEDRRSALTRMLAKTFAEKILKLPSPVEEHVEFTKLCETIDSSSVSNDILWMIDAAEAYASSAEQVEAEKVLIEEVDGHLTYPYYLVRPELFQLLTRARSLGIIPFEQIDALSNMQISVIGASAAQSLLLLLAKTGAGTGAGTIRIADPGITKPSTLAKGIGSPSFARNLGLPKADLVVRAMQAHQPYGSYEYLNKPIKLRDDEGRIDISYFKGSNMVIEVADHAETKLRVQDDLTTALQAQREGKIPADVQLPTIMMRIADVEDDPYVEVIHMESEQRFGRILNPQEVGFLQAYLSGKLPKEAELTVQAIIAGEFISDSPNTLLGVLASPSKSFPQTAGAGLSAASKGVVAVLSMLDDGTETASLASAVKSSYGLSDEQSLAVLSQLFGALTGGVSSVSFRQK